MKTKKLRISALLALFVCLFFCVIAFLSLNLNTVRAEEINAEESEITAVNGETEEFETDKKINALIGKVNGYMDSAVSVWETTWKPLVIGISSSALGLIGAIFVGITIAKKAQNKVLAFRVKNKELETEKKSLTEKLEYMTKREQEQNALIMELSAIKKGVNRSNEIAERTDKKITYIARGTVHAWAECAPAVRETVKAIDGTVNEDDEETNV